MRKIKKRPADFNVVDIAVVVGIVFSVGDYVYGDYRSMFLDAVFSLVFFLVARFI